MVYRETNKEKIAQRMKTYYENNKEKLSQQKKDYYEQHKETITQTKNEKITCEVCGYIFSKSVKARHEKSQRHQKAKKIIQPEEEVEPV